VIYYRYNDSIGGIMKRIYHGSVDIIPNPKLHLGKMNNDYMLFYKEFKKNEVIEDDIYIMDLIRNGGQ
jgi:hypothetical protein